MKNLLTVVFLVIVGYFGFQFIQKHSSNLFGGGHPLGDKIWLEDRLKNLKLKPKTPAQLSIQPQLKLANRVVMYVDPELRNKRESDQDYFLFTYDQAGVVDAFEARFEQTSGPSDSSDVSTYEKTKINNLAEEYWLQLSGDKPKFEWPNQDIGIAKFDNTKAKGRWTKGRHRSYQDKMLIQLKFPATKPGKKKS